MQLNLINLGPTLLVIPWAARVVMLVAVMEMMLIVMVMVVGSGRGDAAHDWCW